MPEISDAKESDGFLMLSSGRGGFCGRHSRLANVLPEFITPGAGFRGERKQPSRGVFLPECAQNIVELIVRKAVAFGGDKQDLASGGAQEIEQLPIALLRGNVDVDQRDAESQRRPLVQVRLDELRPLLRDLTRDLGVTVSWKIGEDQLGARLSRPADFEEIDAAGAPGSGAGAGELGTDKRINHARLSDVRASEEGDFRDGGGREVRCICCRCQKSGEDPHIQVSYGEST